MKKTLKLIISLSLLLFLTIGLQNESKAWKLFGTEKTDEKAWSNCIDACGVTYTEKTYVLGICVSSRAVRITIIDGRTYKHYL